MDKELKCPKGESDKRLKNGINKKTAIFVQRMQMSLQGKSARLPGAYQTKRDTDNGFRRSKEHLKLVVFMSQTRWKNRAKLDKVHKKDEKVEVLELDKLCIKKLWLWTAIAPATKRLVGVQIGTRETKYFPKLTDKISHIDAKFYAFDHWHARNLIVPAKHLTGKAQPYSVERMNRLFRHYIARVGRETYCYSKNLQKIKYSLLLFMHRDFIEHIKI